MAYLINGGGRIGTPLGRKVKSLTAVTKIHSKCINVLNKKESCECTQRKYLKNYFYSFGVEDTS